MDTCLSYFIVIIIFIIIYMNDNESLKSITFIAETCAIHTGWWIYSLATVNMIHASKYQYLFDYG